MKPFECPCCELKFAEPRNVTNHIKRAHQTISPISGVIRITGNFQCPLCSEHDSENFESFKNHLFSSHVPSDEEEKVGRITDKIIKIYIITNYNFRSPAIFVRSLLQWERTSWITSSPPIWAVRCNATTVSSRIQVPVEWWSTWIEITISRWWCAECVENGPGAWSCTWKLTPPRSVVCVARPSTQPVVLRITFWSIRRTTVRSVKGTSLQILNCRSIFNRHISVSTATMKRSKWIKILGIGESSTTYNVVEEIGALSSINNVKRDPIISFRTQCNTVWLNQMT